MKKKILNIINDLDYGGAEKILSKIVNKNLDYETYIISLNNNVPMLDNELANYQDRVYTLRFESNIFILYNIYKIIKIVKKINPDLIVCWMYASCIVSILFRLFLKNKIIIWNIRQSLNDLKAIKFISRLVIRITCFFNSYPDLTIFNSKNAMKQHVSYGFDINKSFYLPNGVDKISNHEFQNEKINLRKDLNLLPNYKIVGLIGNYKPWKDHKLMFKSINEIIKKNKNVYFLLIGRDVNKYNLNIINDDNYAKNIENIRLLGFIEHKYILEYINLFDIYCSTSTNEGFSNTLLEALSLNKVCICSDVGDAKEILTSLDTVYQAGDYNKLSNLILECLKNNNYYEKKFQKESKIIIEKFSTNKMIKIYKTLLDNVLIDIKNA